MARRRLGPPLGPQSESAAPVAAPETIPGAMPPIARLSAQSSAEAALQTLADDIRRARDEGRLVQALSLDDIDPHHLVRDRIVLDDDEMAALVASLRDRGQQTPIEVVDLGEGATPRYGLISGWRRLTALRQLVAEDARFGTVLALMRRPAGAAEAYRAMVEENEIRVGLSYYERARIAARAVAQGVFPDTIAALQGLFPTASRARRSKIGSFVRIHDALDDVLRFPAAIPERLGLALARALDRPDAAAGLRADLAASPADMPAAEMARISGHLAAPPGLAPALAPGDEVSPGGDGPDDIIVSRSRGRLVLSGAGLTEALIRDLRVWLRDRQSGQ